MAVPKHSYIVLTEHAHAHHILVRYDDRPGWLQHIGTMRHKDRADSYVDIENEFADDRITDDAVVDDIGIPHDLPEEAPASALPRVYGTTMPATKTADHPPAGRHDTVPPDNSSVGQAGRPESSGIPDARPAEIPEGSAARKSLGSLPRSDRSDGSHGPGTLAGEAKGEAGDSPSEQTAAPIQDAPGAAAHDDAPRADNRGGVAPVVTLRDDDEVDLAPVVDQLADQEARDKNLSDKQRAIMRVYREAAVVGDWLSLKRIEERSGVAHGSINYTLERLVKMGLLVKFQLGIIPQLPGIRPVPQPVYRDGNPGKPKVAFKDEVTPSSQRRFTEHAALEPELVKGLGADHPAVVEGLKSGPLPPVPGAGSRVSKFNKFSAWRGKAPPALPGAKIETPEEFFARGGKVTKAPVGHAAGSGSEGGVVAVTVRPSRGY